ncbi:MAG: sigma-70 family RNA polymerase sigma factor [Pseudonocardiaceae bacterium]
MPRTRAQLEQATADAEAWLDTLDPSELDNPDAEATDLRRIGTTLGTVVAAERELTEAVRLARAHGRSWADIAMVLGVSREAARKRYDVPAVPQPRTT